MIKCLDCARSATRFFASKMSGLDLLWPLCNIHAQDLVRYVDPDRTELTKDEYLTAKLKRSL